MSLEINLNNRKFRSLSNTGNGEVTDQTIFHYYQDGACIWAEYQGGDIIKGFLIGLIRGDQLEFNYQHLNGNHELMSGKCRSEIELDPSGKVILSEKWQWTCKDFSHGESTLMEI